ncbi:unnamed protein product [Pleuronectes platessa]|uniref:B30.2/SPRY domain-containing protein n=1 Tax=Pleuronectes platessa TaxID=8262 RepID=A0A9N7TR97_PLEPL|nr:unnamed protein product [Pleuronectes platessa]
MVPDSPPPTHTHYGVKGFAALTAPRVRLSLRDTPQKVGVFVDYEEGLLSFYDTIAQSHIHSFTECLFGGEIFPYFSPHLQKNGQNAAPLIISPVERQLHPLQTNSAAEKDKMKILLLTGIIFTVVQTMFTSKQEKPNYWKPCHHTSVEQKYKNFTKRHIIPEDRSLNSIKDWKSYLRDKGLWCRTPKQSFILANMTKDVLQICSRSGLYVKGNLCSSSLKMLVFEVLSSKCPPKNETRKQRFNTRIKVTETQQFVIVACDMVGNMCLPVHFEGNKSLNRTNETCTTRPRPPTNQSKGYVEPDSDAVFRF